jgi:hypothetical protein
MSAHQESAVSAAQVAARPSRAARLASLLEENGTLVIVLAAFATLLVTQLRGSLAPDGWMALLSGREIVQHGLPSHETLTVWAHGRRWVDQQWLAQLVLYGLQRLGGLRLVMLVHAVLAIGGLAGAAVLARRLGASARSVTWVCVPVLAAFWPGAGVMRPQSFAYVLFVGVLWLLLADLRSPSPRVYVTLPLLVLWANLHGSVVVGSALVSGYALLELGLSLRTRPRVVGGRSVVLLAAPWLCVLASPYATSLPTYYRDVLFSGGFGSYVTEWAPATLTFQNAAVYLLALGGLWLIGRAARRLSAFEILAFLGLTALAFDAVRNAVWLALFAVVVLPGLLDSLRGPVAEPKRLNRTLALAMLAGVGVATVGVATEPISWFTRDYPAATANAAAAAAGARGRVFANERYADWLIWTHPALAGRVAYDSRFELLTHRQLRSVTEFRNRVDGWQSTIRGYSVLVLDRQDDDQPRAALLRSGDARTVARKGEVVVLRRTG